MDKEAKKAAKLALKEEKKAKKAAKAEAKKAAKAEAKAAKAAKLEAKKAAKAAAEEVPAEELMDLLDLDFDLLQLEDDFEEYSDEDFLY